MNISMKDIIEDMSDRLDIVNAKYRKELEEMINGRVRRSELQPEPRRDEEA